jgi:hypothetical protein
MTKAASRRLLKKVGLALMFILPLSACSSQNISSEETAKTNLESVKAEPAPSGFLDIGRYSESELASFRSAYESVELEFDEFDEIYTNVAPLNGDAVVAEVDKSGQAAFLQLTFKYGKSDKPKIYILASYIGEDWIVLNKLQIRSMDQTFEFPLDSGARDVISGSLVSEVSGTDFLDASELEFLYEMTQDSEAKARLSGESFFEWDLSEFDKLEFSRAIDAFRHIVLVEHPKS